MQKLLATKTMYVEFFGKSKYKKIEFDTFIAVESMGAEGQYMILLQLRDK